MSQTYLETTREYKSSNKIFSTFMVWEVIAKYFIEEHQRLNPYDYNMINSNEYSSIRKIYEFFLSKNIDLQDKMNYLIQTAQFVKNYLNFEKVFLQRI